MTWFPRSPPIQVFANRPPSCARDSPYPTLHLRWVSSLLARQWTIQSPNSSHYLPSGTNPCSYCVSSVLWEADTKMELEIPKIYWEKHLWKIQGCGVESRWQSRRLQSSHLPTIRAHTRCHWGTLTPKRKGGAPQQLASRWGGARGEEK